MTIPRGLKTSAWAAALLLAACARTPVAPTDSTQKAAAEPPAPTYDAQTLADLLVAEVAAQRNALPVTMGYYAAEARDTADPEVARQAARLAAYLDDPALAAELGSLWLERDPGNLEAHELLALSYIRLGDSGAAAEHIDALLADNTNEALTSLVVQARGLDQQGSENLINALGSLSEHYPEQAPLWYARALSLQMDGDLAGALAATNKALKQDREHEEALLLKARLMYEMGDGDKALRHLARLQSRYPEARRVRATHIRLLLETGRDDKARRELESLHDAYPSERDLLYSLALFGLDQGRTGAVKPTLAALLEEDYRPNDMHLYLGRLAEDEGRTADAIRHYLAIGEGVNALQAQVQAARLMFDSGEGERASTLLAGLRDRYPERMPGLYAAEAEMLANHEQAEAGITLLNEALAEFPDNYDLIYTRAMVAERLDNLPQVEADLRRLLDFHPDDPVVQNALGYTLADRTDRFDEARALIESAYAQRPEDPAIMDSMGWVLYRQGHPDQALPYLQDAWAVFPDHEVGAHLGEVLWQLGQREEARRIWRKALEHHPDSDKVLGTVQRLTGEARP